MRLNTSIRQFVGSLERFRTVFTNPTFYNFVIVAVGWLLSPGRHAVTAALVASSVSGLRHHAAFHRFFSTATWSPDELGRCLFDWLLRFVDTSEPIPLSLDDTLASKKGAKIFGIGNHIDPVRSTKRHRIFSFGHVWVVLAVVIRLPFCRRPWALPVLFRLYRSKKECLSNNKRLYRKKTELAREMLDVFAGWVHGRRCELSADSAYCNSTVTRGLARNIVLFGSMRPDAVLTAAPKQPTTKRMGRRCIRGPRLPTPEVVAHDEDSWKTLVANLYRKTQQVTYKEMTAQWYRACGAALNKVIIVQTSQGNIRFRVFFCTDPELSAQYILERYASRWAIEVTFRDLKQLLGFSESQAWTRLAVLRTAPFVGIVYSVVVLWYAEFGRGSRFDWFPVRPWYPSKAAPSFADMLAALQRTVIDSRLFDPGRDYDDLKKRVNAFASHKKSPG